MSELSPREQRALLAQKQRLEQQRVEMLEGLPHLYGYKWYPWARLFFNSTNRMNLLCAANQISKSSTQIRKMIHWATANRLWPKLWAKQPRVFWYLYPTIDVATIEFQTKILPEFMPRGKFKDDPVYGWEAVYEKGKIHSIRWNSGVTTYFKTYAQQAAALQTGTVDAIFADEEIPEELYDELAARLFASNGYFHLVFTATLNQLMWLRAIEGKGESELFPDAFKIQVSMWDCQVYDDGTPSLWTPERIKEVEAACKSPTEVLRRVHGRFVTELGRKYPQYNPAVHYVQPKPIDKDWIWYVAIDKGGGRKTAKNNHYSAIVWIAVRPDFKLGYVADGWRGDGQELTSQDVLDKLIMMRGRRAPALQIYPHDAKDFGIIAARQSESFIQADKSHERGEDVVNTLFKAGMLYIFDTPELNKLGGELLTLMKSTVKDNAKDDLADALRYCTVSIPWDWNHAKKVLADEQEAPVERDEDGEPIFKPLTDAQLAADEIRRRRGDDKPLSANPDALDDYNEECDEWNDAYGS